MLRGVYASCVRVACGRGVPLTSYSNIARTMMFRRGMSGGSNPLKKQLQNVGKVVFRDSGYQPFKKNQGGGWGSGNSGGGGGGGGNGWWGRVPNRYKLILVGMPVVGGGYYLTHLDTVPISGRRRMIDVSPETEKVMGEHAWQEIKEQYKAHILPASSTYSQMVRRVAGPLIEASGLKDLDWEFIVVEEPQANAFVLPGGKVCVFTGIFPIVETEDNLSAVLAHEIAHVVARHSAENMSFARVLTIVYWTLRLTLQIDAPWLLNLFMQVGVQLPFNRRCESEADHIGLLLMSKACYNPEAAANLWEKFHEHEGKTEKRGSSVSQFLSTHPGHESRAKQIRGNIYVLISSRSSFISFSLLFFF
eukprot:TRINITY_DN2230_c0_g1_i5.p1 TRINITY_DN2230_c0_g1~~TRINITY_DN2230_c0_g1_i5.p1  ORF type:complete len:386 (+),score=70.26 TRINITY_DN2230_c0_g1_i5:75-1160(+)